MKRFTLIIASLALLIGFSHCKKDNDTPNNNGNRIQITLNANYGGNGSRTTFDPEYGTFNWLQGYGADVVEYINVGGSQSGYLGQLNNNDNKGTGTFNGSITTPQDGETLYFFYLGNGSHEGATTLDFSNQSSGTVTNWHIAIGSSSYTSGDTDFSATLNMAMAIAYFDLSGFGSETVTLFGNDVYSTATIDYKNGTITGASKGNINMGTANTGKYIALIPSVTTETVLQFDSDSKTGIMKFLRGIKPASYYSNNGAALSIAANDLFSVSADTKVRFSRGNLQFNKSAEEWSFMEHQFSTVETESMSIGTNYANQNIVSLFGWGTSNYNDKYPYMTATSGYYIDGSITDTEYDWGKHNSSNITNGGGYSGWYTLSASEWTWLIGPTKSSPNPGTNCRSVSNTLSDQARFTLANIDNTYKGMIIFPDTYNHPDGVSITGATYNTFSAYTATLTMNDWNKMENAGAIFLPVAGFRSITTIRYTDNQSNYVGEYWSTTKNGTNYTTMYFKNNQISYYGETVYKGCSVRLVRE